MGNFTVLRLLCTYCVMSGLKFPWLSMYGVLSTYALYRSRARCAFLDSVTQDKSHSIQDLGNMENVTSRLTNNCSYCHSPQWRRDRMGWF